MKLHKSDYIFIALIIAAMICAGLAFYFASLLLFIISYAIMFINIGVIVFNE